MGLGILAATPSSLARVRPSKRVDRVLSWVGIGLVAILVGALVFVAMAPRLLGVQFVVVSGGSMEPTIHFGSVAVMKRGTPRDLAVGDVVMFTSPTLRGGMVTHRIYGISDDGTMLTMKGDANSTTDENLVPVTSVLGSYVFSVPHVGRFVHWMGTRNGYMTVILVPGLAIIALELWTISQNLRKLRAGQEAQPEVVLATAGDTPPAGAAAEGQPGDTADLHRSRWKPNWTVRPQARR